MENKRNRIYVAVLLVFLTALIVGGVFLFTYGRKPKWETSGNGQSAESQTAESQAAESQISLVVVTDGE